LISFCECYKCVAMDVSGIIYTECIPVVREYFWHKVKETVVVFTKDDCFKGNLSQHGLEGWREFALDPGFYG
jgi:hypothetical protein